MDEGIVPGRIWARTLERAFMLKLLFSQILPQKVIYIAPTPRTHTTNPLSWIQPRPDLSNSQREKHRISKEKTSNDRGSLFNG